MGGRNSDKLISLLTADVARLEGIIDVMLQEAENGTLEQAAAEIRTALPQIEG